MEIKVSGKVIARTIKEYVLITAGLLCYAFAWVGVILPAKIVGGGVGGMALLVFYATGGEAGGGIPLAYTMLAINSVLIVIASFVIGFKFTTKTLYAVIMMSVTMGILQEAVPFDVLGLGHDRLLSAILGGVLAGIGITVCFSQGGSTGGTDIIAMIVNKYYNIGYGRVIMFCDFLIIGSSYFVGSGISTVIYSLIVVAALGYTLDALMSGNKQSSQLFIISNCPDLIAEKVSNDIHRGVTLIDGQGWYSKTPMKIVMVVCRKNETSVVFRIIKDCDPRAFITVGSVMGVYGQGFDELKTRKKRKELA